MLVFLRAKFWLVLLSCGVFEFIPPHPNLFAGGPTNRQLYCEAVLLGTPYAGYLKRAQSIVLDEAKQDKVLNIFLHPMLELADQLRDSYEYQRNQSLRLGWTQKLVALSFLGIKFKPRELYEEFYDGETEPRGVYFSTESDFSVEVDNLWIHSNQLAQASPRANWPDALKAVEKLKQKIKSHLRKNGGMITGVPFESFIQEQALMALNSFFLERAAYFRFYVLILKACGAQSWVDFLLLLTGNQFSQQPLRRALGWVSPEKTLESFSEFSKSIDLIRQGIDQVFLNSIRESRVALKKLLKNRKDSLSLEASFDMDQTDKDTTAYELKRFLKIILTAVVLDKAYLIGDMNLVNVIEEEVNDSSLSWKNRDLVIFHKKRQAVQYILNDPAFLVLDLKVKASEDPELCFYLATLYQMLDKYPEAFEMLSFAIVFQAVKERKN